MSNANITKRAIASALKETLESTPFEKVTVRSITAACGISRQSFYNHFHSIYDLIEWAFCEELSGVVADADGWHDALTLLFLALQDERDLIVCCLRSADPVISIDILRTGLTRFVRQAMGPDELSPIASDRDRDLAVEFYASGLAQAIVSWVIGGCTTKPSEMAERIERVVSELLPQLMAPPLSTDGVASC